jgi:aryl-alcohol dehydrogenase-like predicted oxidoreductase
MTRRAGNISRRDAIKVGVGVGLALTLDRIDLFGATQQSTLIEKPIPATGEKIPVIGMGTARYFDSVTPELREVIKRLPELGGKVIDMAPSYGNAEQVVGDIIAELKDRPRYFLATKVTGPGSDRESGQRQMEESMRRLRTDHIDLMQVWNVSSPDVLLPLLDEWKAAKKIRYVGVTTGSANQYAQLETVMKANKLDFIQIDLAIDDRKSQERILPLAADRGMAVLINFPFGRNRVFAKVMGKPLPDWAKDIDVASWPQLCLKYIVGNPAVTTVIPGTDKVQYVVDNLGAARGRLPDTAMRKRIEAYFDAL